MWVYAGMFLIAFATLVVEITLTRLLSVITWYHLAFFAISIAMLGMTAGAVRVYLESNKGSEGDVLAAAGRACLGFALTVPVSTVLLCRMPFRLESNVVFLFCMLASSAACTLPFYFSGAAVSLLLTKHHLPTGRLYSSDLAGASLGCLFVLFGLVWLNATSLLFLAAAVGALAAWCMTVRTAHYVLGRAGLAVCAVLVTVAFVNKSPHGVRPLFVKDRIERSGDHLYEKWNSFSRVVVNNGKIAQPQLWGPSPKMPRYEPVLLYPMNIDGEAATVLRPFKTVREIDHLRYDITSLAYYLRPGRKTGIIGVGAGKDIQTALLFGSKDVLAVELNPVFADLLRGPFKDFAGVAGNPAVRLVVDEARSFLESHRERFDLLQMSLVDTWAATGAGAFSLSENALYTVEAWRLFLGCLAPDGVFTVSRWYSEANLGETGRAISLAVAALFEIGAKAPRRHIALVTVGNLCTVLVRRTPFDETDLQQIRKTCDDLGFSLVVVPGGPSGKVLSRLVTATSPADLFRVSGQYDLNYVPPTDDNPYFFNMLRLNVFEARRIMRSPGVGVLAGNLTATMTLAFLIVVLLVLACATIVLPIWIHSRSSGGRPVDRWARRAGGCYFSLIGLGFMLLEIGLIQRLSVYLGHPVYALGVLLFSIIASTGLGSYVSERLPLLNRRYLMGLPFATVLLILLANAFLPTIITNTIAMPTSRRIAVAVLMTVPLGFILGMFFPTGMRLSKRTGEADLPWFWALNGAFSVVSSAAGVFLSIFFGISTTFYVASFCYAATMPLCAVRLAPWGRPVVGSGP